MNVVQLNKYFQTALLFNIPKSLKRLSFQISKNTLNVLAVFETEPKEFEMDCIYSVTSEVLGNFPGELSHSVCAKVEMESTTVADLSNLVFARYDAEKY
ncbi:hypothetical protein AN944_03893 [Shewanella sp. P1-14-1]|uniref:hypothetical protein n=1 Tax=Shewanella sp. P1-14-1 TaxID=1723761 RepID=UPI0006E537AE|nr:hypothetical protein [Shewanella sp. P1-14-1]KPZ67792.1 hypothetical protein AN944_03893 [Shewanella sp. P1-14-1]